MLDPPRTYQDLVHFSVIRCSSFRSDRVVNPRYLWYSEHISLLNAFPDLKNFSWHNFTQLQLDKESLAYRLTWVTFRLEAHCGWKTISVWRRCMWHSEAPKCCEPIPLIKFAVCPSRTKGISSYIRNICCLWSNVRYKQNNSFFL